MNVQKIMADLEAKHPGESEYLQAVREVLAEAEALREEASGQDEVDQMVKAMREIRLSIRKRPQ